MRKVNMDRRTFIGSGAGAFFIAAAPRAFGAAAPSERVRLAIVGCHAGGRGIVVMRGALKVPGVEIACVCDVDARARDFAAAEVEKLVGYRPRQEVDFRRVVEDKTIDGVVLETPDHWHAYGAVLAMEAGKHVYVEKPCCFCPREGELLVEAWKKTGKVLQVGSQRRASATYRAAFDYLAANGNPLGELTWAKCWYVANRASIGRGKEASVPAWLNWDLWQGPAPRTAYLDNVVHYNWHWFRRWGTGESGNNAPHFADVARWALGVKFPQRVAASGGLLFPKGDDYAWPDTFNMSFEYPGDKLVTFELISHVAAQPFLGATTGAIVYGLGGSVFFGPQDEVRIFDEKGEEARRWAPDATTEKGSLTDPTRMLDVRHLANFAECIRAGSQKTFAPADEGYMSSYMPLAANIALESGGQFTADPSTGRPTDGRLPARWRREYEKGWELLEG